MEEEGGRGKKRKRKKERGRKKGRGKGCEGGTRRGREGERAIELDS